jgi:hypothetical protein
MCAVSLRHFFSSTSLSRSLALNSCTFTAASQKAAEYIKFLGRCWGYSAEPAHCLKNIFVFLSPACVSVCCYYTSLLDEARLMNTWPLNKRGKAVWFKLRSKCNMRVRARVAARIYTFVAFAIAVCAVSCYFTAAERPFNLMPSRRCPAQTQRRQSTLRLITRDLHNKNTLN